MRKTEPLPGSHSEEVAQRGILPTLAPEPVLELLRHTHCFREQVPCVAGMPSAPSF